MAYKSVEQSPSADAQQSDENWTPRVSNRTIYLLVFNSLLFPAHWAMFIPHANQGTIGKIIQVEGNVMTGFTLEFGRNYDYALDSRGKTIIELAQVAAANIVDVIEGGAPSTDQNTEGYY
ncbi:MAG: hypothetical protein M1814_006386 [Vezdaea aestivalis]|nr:MAG: hypothetical protein M1814_006386 [Vezdaea aestivalis]